MQAVLVTNFSSVFIPYTFLVEITPPSADCANATDDLQAAPFTEQTFTISGTICPDDDVDEVSFFLANASRMRFEPESLVQLTADEVQRSAIILQGTDTTPVTVVFNSGTHRLLISAVWFLVCAFFTKL